MPKTKRVKDKKTGKIVERIEATGLTPLQIETRDKLREQKKIKIKLNSTGKKQIIKLNGVEQATYGDVEKYSINGYVSYVQRGVMVEVPEAIANLIKNNERTVEMFDDELQRSFMHGLKATKEYVF